MLNAFQLQSLYYRMLTTICQCVLNSQESCKSLSSSYWFDYLAFVSTFSLYVTFVARAFTSKQCVLAIELLIALIFKRHENSSEIENFFHAEVRFRC